MDDATPRFALPLLAAGQAQKELTHNEALALIDAALHAAVEEVGVDAPPTEPAEGACWIVGSAPTGVWSAHAGAIAGWTDGGWRFVAARDGMSVWDAASGQPARFHAGGWTVGELVGARVIVAGEAVVGAQQPSIVDPAGGSTIDAEARASVAAILAALRTHGLIAS